MKINPYVPDSKIFENIKPQGGLKIDTTDNQDVVEGADKSQSFFSVLKEKLDGVNDKQVSADASSQSFMKGEETDIHKVMLATEEAKMSLELAVQVRNKLVEAYQEINRMQI